MKKSLPMLVLGIILGVLLTLILVVLVLPNRMFIELESKYSFDQTITELEKSAIENKWSIPHKYDLQATLHGKGYNVAPVHVFSLCKPEHAYEILNKNKERLVSSLMPCRVAVYEKNGKTYISMLNSGLFSKFMGKNVRKVMGEASAENQKILKPISK